MTLIILKSHNFWELLNFVIWIFFSARFQLFIYSQSLLFSNTINFPLDGATQ